MKNEELKKETPTKKKIQSFKDLYAWQEGHQLVVEVYTATREFPKDELFGITSQMRRAAVSITSNLAEGFGRGTYRDKAQFYTIAHGSTTELQNQLLVSKDVGYIQQKEFEILDTQALKVERIIKALIKKSKTFFVLFFLVFSTFSILYSPFFELVPSAKAYSTIIFITTTGQASWSVPWDWNSSSNRVQLIGAGGGGNTGAGKSGNTGGGAGGSGGGGAYVFQTNTSLTAGTSITLQVGTSAAAVVGGDSYFNATSGKYLCGNASPSVCAKGGAAGTAGTAGGAGGSGGAGGAAASGVPTTGNTGGTGGGGGAGSSGSTGGSSGGGGGAAGPNGAGGTGVTGVTTTAGAGGLGDNGWGGARGATGAAGGNGTEFNAVTTANPAHGAGGGGGGVAQTVTGTTGGNYGGGGVGGGGNSTNGTIAGAAGASGLIVIQYDPATTARIIRLHGNVRLR